MSTYKNALCAIWDSYRSNGLKKTWKMVTTLDQARTGTLIGVDHWGNEYYENKEDLTNRERYVIYKKWDFDASQIPATWHGWLHKMNDDVPKESKSTNVKAIENMTGTTGAYRPYSTTKPIVTSWIPKKNL